MKLQKLYDNHAAATPNGVSVRPLVLLKLAICCLSERHIQLLPRCAGPASPAQRV